MLEAPRAEASGCLRVYFRRGGRERERERVREKERERDGSGSRA